MRFSIAFLAASLLFSLPLITASAHADPAPGRSGVCTTFADSTFKEENWSAGLVSQLILCEEGLPDGSYDGAYVPTGGNGESYRLATIAYSSEFVEGAQLRDGAIYNPATQGAIQALMFSYDAIYLESFDSSLACFPVLVQGATWYGGPQTSFCACRPGWRHQLFSNLSAAQFFQIIGPGPRHPNFSKFGGPIQFGFGHLIGPSACFDRAVVRSGVDNWRVDVVAECAVPVQVMTWGAIKSRY